MIACGVAALVALLWVKAKLLWRVIVCAAVAAIGFLISQHLTGRL